MVESCGKDAISKLGCLHRVYRDGIPDMLVRVNWRAVMEEFISVLTECLNLCGYGETEPNRWRLELRDDEATVVYK